MTNNKAFHIHILKMYLMLIFLYCPSNPQSVLIPHKWEFNIYKTMEKLHGSRILKIKNLAIINWFSQFMKSIWWNLSLLHEGVQQVKSFQEDCFLKVDTQRCQIFGNICNIKIMSFQWYHQLKGCATKAFKFWHATKAFKFSSNTTI